MILNYSLMGMGGSREHQILNIRLFLKQFKLDFYVIFHFSNPFFTLKIAEPNSTLKQMTSGRILHLVFFFFFFYVS